MDRRTFTRSAEEKNQVRLIRARKYGFPLLILLCICLFLVSSCDKYTRYKVRTFFFTGVPHPDEEAKVVETGLSPEELSRKKIDEFFVPSYVHGPYAAQQCYHCHSTSKSATFRGSAKGPTKTIKSIQEVAGRLVMPLKQLCIDCHTGKSVESAFFKGYWIHGPVSDGICTVCHNPHKSPYPYMLVKGNAKDMCSSCHASGFIMEIEEHKKDEDCTNCHNPHIGKNRFLLKKDLDESSLK
jgi:predicted CXXCH cytochrome family protein